MTKEEMKNRISMALKDPKEYTDLWNELCERAKTFLKEGICQ